MKSIWKSSLSFGMVNMPVKMFAATESHDLKMHQHHGPKCLGSITLRRFCAVCGKEVAYADIISGTDENGPLVTVSKDELEALDTEQGAGIEITEFVHRSEIDPIMYDRTYVLDADCGKTNKDKGPARSYALLRRVLSEGDYVGVVRYVYRQRTHRAVLRVYNSPEDKDGVLVLHTLLWNDEVRPTGEYPGAHMKIDLKPEEVKMAQQVVESMQTDWDPGKTTDTYQERLVELVETKVAGGEFTTKPASPDSNGDDEDDGDVADLLAKLQASVKSKEAA